VTALQRRRYVAPQVVSVVGRTLEFKLGKSAGYMAAEQLTAFQGGELRLGVDGRSPLN